jgi:hypothetical protein
LKIEGTLTVAIRGKVAVGLGERASDLVELERKLIFECCLEVTSF